MRKIVLLTVTIGILTCVLAGCGIFSAAGQKESGDVGTELEKYGFKFVIPSGTTSHGAEGGTYDINFGEGGAQQAFISLNPPEDAPGMNNENFEIDDAAAVYENIMTAGMYDNISNETAEMRSIDGYPAYYYGFDCSILGMDASWEAYMVLSEEKLYAFMVQSYADDMSEETLTSIDDFIASVQFVG